MLFSTGFELQDVARLVEGDLPISTVSVGPSVKVYQYRMITLLKNLFNSHGKFNVV